MDWYVLMMNSGGYFLVQSATRPEPQKTIEMKDAPSVIPLRIAGGSYQIVYGPCTEAEAHEYLGDVGDCTLR